MQYVLTRDSQIITYVIMMLTIEKKNYRQRTENRLIYGIRKISSWKCTFRDHNFQTITFFFPPLILQDIQEDERREQLSRRHCQHLLNVRSKPLRDDTHCFKIIIIIIVVKEALPRRKNAYQQWPWPKKNRTSTLWPWRKIVIGAVVVFDSMKRWKLSCMIQQWLLVSHLLV